MEFLQDFFFDDTSNINSISVDLSIKSEILNPTIITKDLSLQPTRAWTKGEKYRGKTKNIKTNKIEECWRERPWGIWGFNTGEKIKSKSIHEHVELLLNYFKAKKDILKKYLANKDHFSICISIIFNTKIEIGGFAFKNDILKELSELSHYIDFRFLLNKPNI